MKNEDVTITKLDMFRIVPHTREGHGYDCGHPDCEVDSWRCLDCDFIFYDISLHMAKRHYQEHIAKGTRKEKCNSVTVYGNLAGGHVDNR